MFRWIMPAMCAVFFVAFGILLLPYPGLQNDESLFGSYLYHQAGASLVVSIFHVPVPIMLMSYLGALKSIIYMPIFAVWAPSAWSVRLPMILGGAATIWLFYVLLCQVAGFRAAAAGCVLLATDTTFLLTHCFDWGPVALQHLTMVWGILFLLGFHRTRQLRSLAAGFFLFGLAMWDKAVFIWMLSAMAVAALAVFPRQLARSLTVRHAAIALAAFCAGAFPLIKYNVKFPLDTFRSNSSLSADDLGGKALQVRTSLDGSGLFGYIARVDDGGRPRQPQTTIERASVWLAKRAGEPVRNVTFHAFAVALLLLPFLWRTPARQPMLFALLTMAVAWLQMAAVRNAGGSVHHVVLLWPFPHLLIALALAEMTTRLKFGPNLFGPNLVLALALTLLAGSNLLVMNEYLSVFVRNGAAGAWTDAMGPLSDALEGLSATTVYPCDWGMFDSLLLLHRGKLPLQVGSDPLSKPQLDAADRRVVLDRLADPGAVFLTYTDGNEEFPGVNAHLREIAQRAGFRRDLIRRIFDRNGRPIFEVARFVQ